MVTSDNEWIIYGTTEDDPYCIHSVKQLTEYINEIGFLPLFANEIPAFSVEERTVADYWWTGHEKDPWYWREIIAREGNVIYGKFFNKKAGFISKEWFPYFANARRDGYDFDSLYEDGKASMRQKKIMDQFVEEDTRLVSYELKQLAGFSKGGEKNFEGTLTGLMMQTYLCMRDFTQKKNKKGEYYGWHVAVYSTPEELYGYRHVTSRYSESPAESRQKIIEHIKDIYPIAEDKNIKKVLSL